MKKLKIFNTVIFLLVFNLRQILAVRVCLTYKDYFSKSSSKCYKNNHNELNMTQVLRKMGFTAEEYNIHTQDGYQLLVVRTYRNIDYPTPLILTHGMLNNGGSFLVTETSSFVYQLIQSGRQVFIVNLRGTRYSRGHTNLSSDDLAYWNFSCQELAVYDVPSVIKLVLNVTSSKPIYIGYSLGSTIGLAYATLFSEQAKNQLLGIITLGTACFPGYTKSLPMKILATLHKIFKPIALILWNGEFLPRKHYLLLGKPASRGPIQFLLLYQVLALFAGTNWPSISPEHFPIFALEFEDTVSLNVIIHLAQMTVSGQYRQFDYGIIKNSQIYGSIKPPIYNLTKIEVPVAQFMGEGDLMTTVKNGHRVNSYLKPKVQCGFTVLNDTRWTHFNFLEHKNQQIFLGIPLLQKIMAMENDAC